MPYVPGVLQDLFLSYAHADDPTWLSSFERALSSGLRERLGEPVAIWQDSKQIRFGARWEDEIKEGISGTATFLALVSPNYLHSKFCQQERTHFLEDPSVVEFSAEVARRQRRFLKAIKAPADGGAHDSLMSASQFVRFFRLGDARMGDQIFDPESTEFRNSMQEMVTGIVALLKAIRRSHQPVFLANVATDAVDEREMLRSELAAQGFDVRPHVALDGSYDDPFLRKEIDAVELPVFLLKNFYDKFVERLLRVVSELEQPAVLWLPRQVPGTVVDPDQNRLLLSIRKGELLPKGSAILETPSPRSMIREVLEVLHARKVEAPALAAGPRKVYLLYDADSEPDSKLAAQVRHYVREAGLEVLEVPPAKTGTATDRIESHRALLRECDAVLLCRAAAPAPDQWLFQTVPEVLFAEQQLNRPPFVSRGFLLGQPDALGGLPDVIQLGERLTADQLEDFLIPLRPLHVGP